jgi:hypothetical protein
MADSSRTKDGFYQGDQVEVFDPAEKLNEPLGEIVEILDADSGYCRVRLRDGRTLDCYDTYLTRR